MKHFGCIMDFVDQRNHELMNAYRLHLDNARFIVMSEIFKLVADTPCSRFWVSEERAAIVISAMHAGRPLPPMKHNKQQMFDEIYRRFLIQKINNPSASVFNIVSDIVYQPAPRFYLTPRTVGEIIYRIKNNWYDTQFQKYNLNRNIP